MGQSILDSDAALAHELRRARPSDRVERDRTLAAIESAMFGKPSAPPTFGRYIVLERIGAGGEGVVHLAYDPELDRRVAIKLVATGDGSAAHADLLREAQAAASLAHPNVLAIHDVGSFAGQPSHAHDGPEHGVYLVSEFVEGETFDHWCTRTHPQPHAIVAMTIGICRGLAAAHARGIVHVDVKPRNILVDRDGRPRVLDFGLARRLDGRHRDGSHRSGGTPAYMAVEQHDPRAAIDARADVFAVCVVLYEALFGRRPFAGRDADELLAAKHRGVDFPGGHGVPGWLLALLRRGLCADPDGRPPTMHALVEALERRRARTIRRVAAVAVAMAAVTTAVIVAATQRHARAAACRDRGAELAGAWDEGSRRALAEAFAAAEAGLAPGSTSSWPHVAEHLDAYAARWSSTREQACRATMVDDAASLPTMNARMLCLDRRRTRLGSLVRRLREVELRTVGRAGQGVAELPAPESCMDARADDETIARSEVLAFEAELADADALRHGERFAEAEAANDRAHALAAGRPRWLAQALLQRSRLARWRGDFGEAERALDHGFDLAERAGDDGIAAEIAVEQGFVWGVPGARPEAGLRALALAEAKLVRIGGDPALALLLGYHRGRVLEAAERFDEAEAVLATTLTEARATYGSAHPVVADVANMLGVLAEHHGDWELALTRYGEAHAMHRALAGPMHARSAITRMNVVHLRWWLGQAGDSVIDDAREVVAVLRQTAGVDHVDTMWSRELLAEILIELERPAEALVEAEALTAVEAAFAPEHPYVVDALDTRASALSAVGRFDQALAVNRRAVAATRASGERPRARALLQRAEILGAAGRCDEAVVELDAAELATRDAGWRAEALRLRGRCDLTAGRDVLALLRLGHAHALVAQMRVPIATEIAFRRDVVLAMARFSRTSACAAGRTLDPMFARSGVRPSWRRELTALCDGPHGMIGAR